MKILIMGLPGSGKTTQSKALVKILNAGWLNADLVRKKYNDWKFDLNSRLRQARRMRDLSNELLKRKEFVIADFVCPTDETRKIYNPDFVIWMNTLKKSRFSDTNQIFKKPNKSFVDVEIKKKDSEKNKFLILEKIKMIKLKKQIETIKKLK